MTNSKTQYIPELDGLRGGAVLLVISFHYFGGSGIFSFGWSGVDLFFVLSGYLITSRLLISLNQPYYFTHFYRNRILRIFPLYYFVLIIFFICILWIVPRESVPGMNYYTTHWKSFFVFTENWTYISYGLPQAAYLTHFWSLAVEEQFYLIWPFAIFFIVKSEKRYWILTIVIALVIIIRSIVYARYPAWDDMYHYYYNSFCRMDSLIIGAMLSMVHSAKFNISQRFANMVLAISAAVIGCGIALAGSIWTYNAFFGTIGYTVIAVFYASILHLATQPGHSLLHMILNIPLLRRFGKISFGLYVYHWPILLIIKSFRLNWNIFHSASTRYGTALLAACCLSISWGISELSFRYLETYFLRLKRSTTEDYK